MRFSKNILTPFTVTIATPGVFTAVDHELGLGDTVKLETTDTLPTGLAVETLYYVIGYGYTVSTFQLSKSKGGVAIDTTGSQAGTHQFIKQNRARFNPNVENCR